MFETPQANQLWDHLSFPGDEGLGSAAVQTSGAPKRAGFGGVFFLKICGQKNIQKQQVFI